MSELELSNNPNVDTGFVTDGNQKNKVQLVAQWLWQHHQQQKEPMS